MKDACKIQALHLEKFQPLRQVMLHFSASWGGLLDWPV